MTDAAACPLCAEGHARVPYGDGFMHIVPTPTIGVLPVEFCDEITPESFIPCVLKPPSEECIA